MIFTRYSTIIIHQHNILKMEKKYVFFFLFQSDYSEFVYTKLLKLEIVAIISYMANQRNLLPVTKYNRISIDFS